MKISLFLRYSIITFLLCAFQIHAQSVSWSKMRGPYTGSIQLVYVDRLGDVIASTADGFFRSTDHGKVWQQTGFSLTYGASFLLTDSNNYLYTGSITEGAFLSTDGGAHWTRTNYNDRIYSGCVLSGNRICIGGVQTVSISTDQGQTWSVSRPTPYQNSQILSLTEDNNGYIYAGTQSFTPRTAPRYAGGIYYSKNNGKLWQFYGMDTLTIEALVMEKGTGTLYALINQTVYSTQSSENNWVKDNVGFSLSASIIDLQITNSGEVIAITNIGVFVHNAMLHRWEKVTPDIPTVTITTSSYNPGSATFAGTDRNGMFYLDDSSQTWIQCGINQDSVTAVGLSDDNILYAGTNDGIYKQTSLEGLWQRVSDGLGREKVFRLTYDTYSGRFYAITAGGLFFLSDNKTYWIPLTKQWVYDFVQAPTGEKYAGSTGGVLSAAAGDDLFLDLNGVGLPVSKIYAIAIDSSENLYAGTRGAGVFKSTNGGTFWNQTGISSSIIFNSINTMTIDPYGRIFAGTDSSGLYYSDNAGTTWNYASTVEGNTITCILADNPSLYISGTMGNGVFASTDRGTHWKAMNNGLTDFKISSLFMNVDRAIYAATTSGIFYTTITTAVSRSGTGGPVTYRLMQNYPNPFNPVTTIQFSVPNDISNRSQLPMVALIVYDMTGREIATIVHERKMPGMYEVRFDGSMCSSGIYFYSLTIDGYTQTKSMVLIK